MGTSGDAKTFEHLQQAPGPPERSSYAEIMLEGLIKICQAGGESREHRRALQRQEGVMKLNKKMLHFGCLALCVLA